MEGGEEIRREKKKEKGPRKKRKYEKRSRLYRFVECTVPFVIVCTSPVTRE